MEFLVVDALSSYTGLICRPALNRLKATISMYSLTLEVRTATRLFIIRGDYIIGREWFVAARAKAEHDTTNITGFEKGESNKKLVEHESFVIDTGSSKKISKNR